MQTQTSGFCRRRSNNVAVPATVSKQRAPGFTLIEVLVVLVLVGLVAGVALPRLLAISQRFEAAASKKQVLAEIAGLGY